MANANLKSQIARRKALDRVFAFIGVLSVVVALSTLATLMARLAADARQRAFVPKGSVAIARGEQPRPGGRAVSPADQAWEMRKISGDALLELKQDEKMRALLLDIDQLVDIPRLKREAQAGTLRAMLDANRWSELVRTAQVRELIAAGKAGKLVKLDGFMPADYARQLQEDGRAAELLDLETLKEMVQDDAGLAVLFNRLNLKANANIESGPSIFQRWVTDGDFESNLPRILNQRKIMSLVREDRITPFIEREMAVAKARPKEVNTAFFTTLRTSSYPETAGILTAWVGSLCVITVCMLSALPVGVAAGIYLEEYARKNRVTGLIEINIANLAGVPSIIYGLMALGLFVYLLHMGRTIATAGLTLALLVMPIVIMATREAIRAIPQHIREASYACGATRWQTVWHHILPYSSGGILTGSIIALSRAIGETAPIITIALVFVTGLPPSPVQDLFPFLSFAWLKSDFTVMPLLMFNWTGRPEADFRHNAALAGLVLILMTLGLNAVAIYLRYRLRKSIKW